MKKTLSVPAVLRYGVKSCFPRLVIVLVSFFAITLVNAGDATLKKSYQRPADIPFPPDNPYTPVKAALGKLLFFDPRLSQAQNMNCATCHNPSFGWEMPLPQAVGSLGTKLRRHAPTVLNMAWGDRYFWDGRAGSLEEQAGGPIAAPEEMNLPIKEAVARIRGISGYQYWFQQAFPGQGVTKDTLLKAIATYERTIVSPEAPFDRWVEGDDAAISEQAKQGFELFNGKAQCSHCHSGWNFTDSDFHDIGLPNASDRGRIEITGDQNDQYGFKTPSLRNINQRAPYMHDGSLATMEAVITHYAGGGVNRPSLSSEMKPFSLTPNEMAALIAFLDSLSGPNMVVSLPVLPN